MRALATVVVALALGACGDDDNKTDTADSATTEVTGDTTTGTETTTDATTPEDTEVVTTTDATTPEDGDATTSSDTEVVEPPQTFPEFVIELIEDHTADDTEPVSYTTFSTLEDDETEGVFDGLFD